MAGRSNDKEPSALRSFVDAVEMFVGITVKLLKFAVLPVIWTFKILNMFMSIFKIILLLLLVGAVVGASSGSLVPGGEIGSLITSMIEMLTVGG
jgi:ribose/xylose/arabinose/galactoside ABC-type transport system permease subunit